MGSMDAYGDRIDRGLKHVDSIRTEIS